MTDQEILDAIERLTQYHGPGGQLHPCDEPARTRVIGLLARMVFAGEWRAKGRKPRGCREVEVWFAYFVKDPTCLDTHARGSLFYHGGFVCEEAFRLAAEALR